MSSSATPTRIAVIGHQSADPEGVAQAIPDTFSVSVAYADQLNYEFPEFAAVVLAISAYEGAPNSLIDVWNELAELLIPRAIVITKIEHEDADFDEAVLIARRMFGEGVTPYLVLHADSGEPCAFIDLESLDIRDYSTGKLEIKPSDEDHRILVSEFRDEYLESIEELDEQKFATGLFVPIIPYSASLHLGPVELLAYLNEVIES